MIQIRDDFNIIDVIYPNIAGCEAVLAIIEKEGLKFKLIVIYCPPRNDQLAFIESFDTFSEHMTSIDTPTFICGYFNIEILKTNLIVQS